MCTSFDSYEDVTDKYPESKSILKKLQKDSLCIVVHSVNATTISKYFPNEKFDEIIFNFPHLGFEDLHSHRALIAHFLHSSLECLVFSGFIHVALSSEQSEKWEIRQTGIRFGLECVSTSPILSSQWPGYMLKRHHTGKSFVNRVNNLYHFTFRRVGEISDSNVSLLQELYNSAASTMDTPRGVNSKETKEKGKKRVHMLVEGKYVERDSEYLCLECHRTFPTEQGARTHVYNVHILAPEKRQSVAVVANPDNDSTIVAKSAPPSICQDCGKECPDSDALQQHMIAKHTGGNVYILPYWRQGSSADRDSTEESGGQEECDKPQCPVCLLAFDSETAVQVHLADGLIPISSECTSNMLFICDICCKQFAQERALLQHKNFCALKVNSSFFAANDESDTAKSKEQL
eukprot:gene34441-41685_t